MADTDDNGPEPLLVEEDEDDELELMILSPNYREVANIC